MNNNTIFNTGDIITHKDSDNTNPYYYIVINRFNKYQHEYYSLFCLTEWAERTLRMDNQKHYRVVSSV